MSASSTTAATVLPASDIDHTNVTESTPKRTLSKTEDSACKKANTNGLAKHEYTRPNYPAVTQYLCVKDAPKAIQFYKDAFLAKEHYRMDDGGSTVYHCELDIFGHHIMVNEEMNWGGPDSGFPKAPTSLGNKSPVSLVCFMPQEEADAALERAVKLGAVVEQPFAVQFWGDRSATITDPFGHRWMLSTHVDDVPLDTMSSRIQKMGEMFAAAAAAQASGDAQAGGSEKDDKAAPAFPPCPSFPIEHPAKSWLPDGGWERVTPYLTVKDVQGALEYYKKAFDAEVVVCFPGPDGTPCHAELNVFNGKVMVGPECPGMSENAPTTIGGTTLSICVYTPDVDAAFEKAVAAGGKAMDKPTDEFYGDRAAGVSDPYGHRWHLATFKKMVPVDEMKEQMTKMMQEMQQQPQQHATETAASE